MEEVHVTIQNYIMRHINTIIILEVDGVKWKFTGLYGHLEIARRKKGWALLPSLAWFNPLPWLCIGDFNEIIYVSKKNRRGC